MADAAQLVEVLIDHGASGIYDVRTVSIRHIHYCKPRKSRHVTNSNISNS